MQRRLFIAGNWKLNHNQAATRATAAKLRELLAEVTGLDMAICPPFTSLGAAVEALAGSRIQVGAQNLHWEDNGAYTGEISAAMLQEIPVNLVIIGHSERRQYFGETDATVNRRLKAALKAGMTPIVCIGELLAERQAGKTEEVLARQVRGGLAEISAADMAKTVIAYEPVWAIGTGVTASPAQAQEAHAYIRGLLRELYGATADVVRIQYGGSVKASNAKELMSQPDIDGALVGGASLKADDFAQLIKNCL
jgi:triosephosphate isomerase (TIM)